MKNLKKLLVVLLIAVLMIGVSNIALATEEDENVTFIPDENANNTTNSATNNSVNNTTNKVNNNVNTNNTVKNTTNNTNSSKYNNTSLPKAGASDGITVMVVVAVFGISAIYAYKKIKDYNVK